MCRGFLAMSFSALLACGRTTAAPAPAKWVGPWAATPNGGRRQTTIYYGPWQCTTQWLQKCSAKCASEGHRSMGYIWIADIKYDWQGTIGPLPAAAGGAPCDHALLLRLASGATLFDTEGARGVEPRTREVPRAMGEGGRR